MLEVDVSVGLMWVIMGYMYVCLHLSAGLPLPDGCGDSRGDTDLKMSSPSCHRHGTYFCRQTCDNQSDQTGRRECTNSTYKGERQKGQLGLSRLAPLEPVGSPSGMYAAGKRKRR